VPAFGGEGDDGEGDFPEPPDSRGIDPELIAACAAEPLNDTGNGQRLLKHFGNRILRHFSSRSVLRSISRCHHRTSTASPLSAQQEVAVR
jgi:hypothetical protein